MEHVFNKESADTNCQANPADNIKKNVVHDVSLLSLMIKISAHYADGGDFHQLSNFAALRLVKVMQIFGRGVRVPFETSVGA